MRTLLDSILDNYAAPSDAGGSGLIVTENHNLGDIDWVAGVTDPGEMIGCGRYQELRRLDGEADGPYLARLRVLLANLPAADRAKIESTLKAAAIKRASVDTTGGKVAVVVVGEPAWHKLGVNVSRALTAAEAIKLASMDWSVSKRPVMYDFNGELKPMPGQFVLSRDDSGKGLAVVGPKYKPIQNAQGFDFLDSVLGEFGGKFHTAGSVFGGGKVWMQCELPGHSFRVRPGDEVQAFATFTNPHDGSGKAWCFPTTNRIVCANTYRTASRERSGGLGIPHTGDIKARIAQAREALGLAVQEIDDFRETAEVMARTPVAAGTFFSDLLDKVADVTAERAKLGAEGLARLTCEEAGRAVLNLYLADSDVRDSKVKAAQRLIDSRRELLDDMLTRYHSERCGNGGGTAWDVFNAVTEAEDYRQPKRQVGTAEERLSRAWESSLNGDRDKVKQIAFEMLTVGSRS